MQTRGVLSGRVLRAADATPIDGAVVVIAAERHVWAESTPPSIAMTGADGTWSATSVAPGTYVLTVTAAGFVPVARALAAGEQRMDIEVSLEVGGSPVRGVITNQRGEPIVRARVRALRDDGSPYFVTFSGSDGRYELSLGSGSYQLEVTHDEYRRGWRNISTSDDKAEAVSVSFTLVRGGILNGQVIARDTGEPLPHAEVNGFGGRDFSRTRADADGKFTLRGLHDGTISVVARGRGYASVKPSTVELGVGERVEDICVTVDHAFSIAGRVVAAEERSRGLVGVTVNAMAMGDRLWPVHETSDADGYFQVVGLLPGRYILSADKRGMLFEGGIPVEVTDADVSDVIIEMKAGAILSGCVDPPVVAQIALARVGAHPLGASDKDVVSIAKARTVSDRRGAFTLRDVPSGDFEVSAMSEDGSSGTVHVSVTGVDVRDLVIRLSPRVTVSGRVIDTTGMPVAGVYVLSIRGDVPLATRFKRDGIYRGATTSTDGAFKIVGLDAGIWQLTVTEPRGASSIGNAEVDILDGLDRDGVTITVEARDASISGTVLGSDDKPVEGAQVRAMREVSGAAQQKFDSQTEPVRTDASGRFAIEKTRAGSYTLVVRGPRGASTAHVAGVKTGDSVTITLVPLSSLRISVTHRGAPTRNVHVTCWGPAGTLGLVEEIDDAHTFTEVAQGEWRCDAKSEDGSAKATIVVGTEPAKLTLALDDYGSVTGIAVDALTDQPVPNLAVMARGTSTRTDADGRFVLERIPAGPNELLLTAIHQLGAGYDKVPCTAKPGERVDVGRIKVVSPRSGDVGTFGLSLDVSDAALVVAKVRAGSPADRAGIKVGDTICAIDHQLVPVVGLERAKRLLTSEHVGVGRAIGITLASGTHVSLTAVKW